MLSEVIDAANQDPWTKAQNLAQITGGIGQLGGTSSISGIILWHGNVPHKKDDPGIFGDILAGIGAGANLFKGIGGLGAFSSFGQGNRMPLSTDSGNLPDWLLALLGQGQSSANAPAGLFSDTAASPAGPIGLLSNSPLFTALGRTLPLRRREYSDIGSGLSIHGDASGSGAYEYRPSGGTCLHGG